MMVCIAYFFLIFLGVCRLKYNKGIINCRKTRAVLATAGAIGLSVDCDDIDG